MSDELIMVDLNDEEVGHQGKMDTHRNASLHRAFSVFLYKIVDEKCIYCCRNAQKKSIIREVCGRMPAVPIQDIWRHLQKRYHAACRKSWE